MFKVRNILALSLACFAGVFGSAHADADQIAIYEPGCFPPPPQGDGPEPLIGADATCAAALDIFEERAAPGELDALRDACDAARWWEVRGGYATALRLGGDWDRATEVAEDVLGEVGAPYIVNWILTPMHHGDWIAARAERNPSASCMAAIRFEDLAEKADGAALLTQTLLEKAQEYYRPAAEAGLPKAIERLGVLSGAQ